MRSYYVLTFGITIASDYKNIHPTEFCYSCFNVIVRCTKAKETKEPYQHTIRLFQWMEHSEPCFVCKHFTQVSRGGRRKKSHIGRPPKVNIHAAIRHIKSVAPESFQVSIDHSRINLPPINISDLKCPHVQRWWIVQCSSQFVTPVSSACLRQVTVL